MNPNSPHRCLAPALTLVAIAALVAAPAMAGEGCRLCAASKGSDAVPDDASPIPEPVGTLLTDFGDPDHNARWRVVNDNVMGGRSIGELSFQSAAPDAPVASGASGATLTFEGFINTNGGGFASVRLPLPPDALVGASAIRLTLQSDHRNIYLRVDDDRPHRGRNINHRGAIPLDPDAPADQWQTVTVPLADLAPAWRGRPVPDAPEFAGEHATRLGLMINDTEDGRFRLVIDRIEVIPRPEPVASAQDR